MFVFAFYLCFFAFIYFWVYRDVKVLAKRQLGRFNGRADIVVIYEDQVFVFELKVADGTDVEAKAEQALAQMRDRDYAGKYRRDGNQIYLLAVVFDREKRNLATIRSLLRGSRRDKGASPKSLRWGMRRP